MIVAEQSFEKLKQSQKISEKKIGQLLDSHRHAVVLGSMGPDLFFWAPDYEIVKWPLQFYKNFYFLIELYDNTIGLVKDTIDELGKPIEKTANYLAPNTIKIIKSLIKEIQNTLSTFTSTLSTGLFAGIIEGYDFLANMGNLPTLSHQLFDMFKPPLQGGKNEEKWYWFDMLHYRFTGKFAKNLVKLSKTDEQKAYAYSYLTHITTDTVGHPFVNQIVGGPYRLHPQRHATCENFIDTWSYHKQYGESINSTLHDRAKLPKSEKPYKMNYQLSNDITNLLYQAFIDTYKNPPSNMRPKNINKDKGENAGFLTEEDIQETYKVFCFIMQVLGNSYVEKPKEPFSGILDILNDLLKNFKAPPSPPQTSSACSIWDILSFGTTQKSRDCYSNFVQNIGTWMEYIGELLKWAFETINSLLDMITTILLSLPITVVMAILYGIQILLYGIYRQARLVLALNGFVSPEPDEVLGLSFGRNLITPYQCIYITTFAPEEDFTKTKTNYPRTHSCTINHLQCPSTTPETPTTTCSWYPRTYDLTPDIFIRNEPFNEQNIQLYAKAANPNETRQIQTKRLTIGNAIDFSVWMIKNAINQNQPDIVYTDWNLDSDRGYGFKCWNANNLPKTNLTNEKYI